MRLCDDKLPARCTKQVGRGDARGGAAARRRAARGRARFAELSERG
jgi:hypothetical protein